MRSLSVLALKTVIVKETIQKLKGNVSIESEINKGTKLKMHTVPKSVSSIGKEVSHI